MPKSKSDLIGNRYRIISSLGEGGMGSVFLVEDVLARVKTQKRVALKFFPQLKRSIKSKDWFQSEIRILQKVNHPNLVHILDWGEDPIRQQYFFTTPFIEGKDIRHVAFEKSEEEMLRLCFDLCEVLVYLHSLGVLHNDIKPSNVLVDTRNRVHLIDFGVSQLHDSGRTTTIGGTPGYLAPERLKGSPPSIASDLYAMGMLMVKVFWDQLPFESSHEKDLIRATLDQRRIPLSDLPKKVSSPTLQMIERLIAHHPAKRFHSTVELHDHLAILLGQSQGDLIEKNITHVLEKPPWIPRSVTFEEIVPQENAEQKRPSLTLIEGPSRCGKTRFADELYYESTQREIPCVQSRFMETPGTDLTPFRDMVLQWCSYFPGTLPDEIQHSFLQEQEDMSPEYIENYVPIPPDSNLLNQYHLLEFLEKLEWKNHGVVIFDDAQNINHEQFRWIQTLLQHCKKKIALVFMVESNSSNPWVQKIKEDSQKKFQLDRFSHEETKRWLHQIFGPSNFTDSDILLLQHKTKGEPFKIRNSLLQGIQKKYILYKHNQWKVMPEFKEMLSHGQDESIFSSILTDSNFEKLIAYIVCWQGGVKLFDLEKISKIALSRIQALENEFSAQEIWKQGRRGEYQITPSYREIFFNLLIKKHGKKWIQSIHQTIAQYFDGEIQVRPSLKSLETSYFHLQKAHLKKELPPKLIDILDLSFKLRDIEKTKTYLQFTQDQNLSFNQSEKFQYQWIQINVYRSLGDNVRAKEELETWLERAPKNHPLWGEAQIAYASLTRKLGNYQKAFRISKDALASGSNHPDQALQLRLLSQMALSEFNQGKVKHAFGYLDEAKSLSKQVRSRKSLGNYYLIYGLIRLQSSPLDPHIPNLLKQAYQELKTSHDTMGETAACFNLAIYYGNHKDPIHEMDYYKKALESARKGKNLQYVLTTLKGLGVLFQNRGQNEEALEYFQKALRIASLKKNEGLQGELHLQISKIKLVSFQLEKALRHAYQAKKHFRQMGHQENEMKTWLQLAEIKLKLGKVGQVSKILSHPSLRNFTKTDKTAEVQAYFLNCQILIFQGGYENVQDETLVIDPKHPSYEYVQHEKHFIQLFANLINHIPSTPYDIAQLDSGIQFYEEHSLQYPKLRNQILCYFLNQDVSGLEKFWQQSQEDLNGFPEQGLYCLFFLGILFQEKGQGDQSIQYLSEFSGRLDALGREWKPAYWRDFQGSFLVHFWKSKIDHLYQKTALRESSSDQIQKQISSLRSYSELLESMVSQFFKTPIEYSRICKEFKEWSNSSYVGIYLLQNNQLICQGESQGHDFSTDKQSRLEKKLFTFFSQSVEQKFETYSLIPLYQWHSSKHSDVKEKVPLGILLFQRNQRISKSSLLYESECIQRFARILMTHIQEVLRKQKFEQSKNLSTQDLTSTRYLTIEINTDQLLREKFSDIIIGKSPMMKICLHNILKVAPLKLPVVIEGESGSGKEKVAQSIHQHGDYPERPWVAINCGALTSTLVESELFGYQRGAFTGAEQAKSGLIQMADGGTLFLDEIGELDLAVQAKLLRVLQEGEFRPLGSQVIVKSDFRLICATHRNLKKWVESGKFREDLYYRINGITLEVPSLRERREDIPLFVRSFLKECARKQGKTRKTITARAMKALTFYSWPGNVRQLQNIIEMLTTLVSRKRIDFDDLPPEILGNQHAKDIATYKESFETFRQNYFRQVLQSVVGKVSKAAKVADIRREHMYTIIRNELGTSKK